MIEKVKSALGVDWHKTVAAYSPSHNGKIEKFVDTLKTALRKLSERDHLKWADMIPFVKLAYNTRVHSVTKMSPFEVMFGIKANSFDNYEDIEGEIDSETLLKRVNQIAELVKLRNKVVENINEKQQKQLEVQNKRTKRMKRTFLEKGTVCYRKNDGILTALAPRWIGPYTILDHDERGNYLLVDSLGVGLQQKIPLEKLLIVDKSQQQDNVVEVKEILKDRTIENKIEYFVEWKDGTKSWVKEDSFQTVEKVNDYWKGKDKKDEVKRRKREEDRRK